MKSAKPTPADERDRVDIASIVIVAGSARMTLVESLACAYRVEGILREDLARARREIAAERARTSRFEADLTWIRADATSGGDA